MTTGALIFAYNNDQVDYVSMAAWSARNIRRHLGIPVAVVTDQPVAEGLFDHVIVQSPHISESTNTRYFSDYGAHVIWRNTNRASAHDLTPWDQTLVLDADYVVASSDLNLVLESSQDFLAHRWAYDITGQSDFEEFNYFGNYRMPMWWATVMMFRRSRSAELIFDAMNMIRNNWTHYRRLYGNTIESFRNDHALSIALGIVNGHTLNHLGIPWPLASLTPVENFTQVDQDHYRVEFIPPDRKKRWISIKNQDFHTMGKRHLEAIIASSS
jgi:hypothetical protein